MQCAIYWLDPTTTIRKEHFQKVKNANILQDPCYGRALESYKQQTPRYALIKIDGKPAGYMQILESRALRGLLHAVILDRGPLWFPGYGDFDHFQAFLHALTGQFPARPGRAVRFLPEIPANGDAQTALEKAGFKKKSEQYQTLVVDLQPAEDQLRANLKGKWRGWLNKAEKEGLEIDWTDDERILEWFLKFYRFDMKTKGYDGPPVELIKALAAAFKNDGNVLIGRALRNNKAIAAIMIFCHGRGATYQIGWNTQEGRACGANHLLLWQACLRLKSCGYETFDLGGVNDEDARNIKTFKEGMGGRAVSLPGIYTY